MGSLGVAGAAMGVLGKGAVWLIVVVGMMLVGLGISTFIPVRFSIVFVAGYLTVQYLWAYTTFAVKSSGEGWNILLRQFRSEFLS